MIDGLEDSEDYRGFEAAIIAGYDAETAVERELVLHLASLPWRLRRIIAIERRCTADFPIKRRRSSRSPKAIASAATTPRYGRGS